jgi:thiol-disulfide isomerase/thioredoxin
VTKYLFAALIALFSTQASASTSLIFRPFEEKAYAAAVKANKNILLVFSKSDCPSCLTQSPNLKKVLAEPAFASIEVFQIDAIKSKDLTERFKVNGWTILVLQKGEKEIGRGQGIMTQEHIRGFLSNAK